MIWIISQQMTMPAFVLLLMSTSSSISLLLLRTACCASLGVGLEQAFLRHNFNQDFSITAGRQLTVLGFEKDESPNMYQTSYAYD